MEVSLPSLPYVITVTGSISGEGGMSVCNQPTQRSPTTTSPSSTSLIPLIAWEDDLLESLWLCDQKKVIEFAPLNR